MLQAPLFFLAKEVITNLLTGDLARAHARREQVQKNLDALQLLFDSKTQALSKELASVTADRDGQAATVADLTNELQQATTDGKRWSDERDQARKQVEKYVKLLDYNQSESERNSKAHAEIQARLEAELKAATDTLTKTTTERDRYRNQAEGLGANPAHSCTLAHVIR